MGRLKVAAFDIMLIETYTFHKYLPTFVVTIIHVQVKKHCFANQLD